MAEKSENLTPVFPRRMAARVDRLAECMREVRIHFGTLDLQYAGVSRRVDRTEERLDRTGRRLGLVEN